MSCFYQRGRSLWIAFKDEQGKRVCRPSGYKVGQEEAVRVLLAELDRKATEAVAAPDDTTCAGLTASAAPSPGQVSARGAMQAVSTVAPAPAAASTARSAAPAPIAGPSVRDYGEQWLTTREHIETYADECGRLRNHVFPRIGDLRMRDVRPRHIRDVILDLKKSNVHRRGTGQGARYRQARTADGASRLQPDAAAVQRGGDRRGDRGEPGHRRQGRSPQER